MEMFWANQYTCHRAIYYKRNPINNNNNNNTLMIMVTVMMKGNLSIPEK